METVLLKDLWYPPPTPPHIWHTYSHVSHEHPPQTYASHADLSGHGLSSFLAQPSTTWLLGSSCLYLPSGADPHPRVLEWRQEGNQGLGEKLPTHYGPGALTRPTLVCVAQCTSP